MWRHLSGLFNQLIEQDPISVQRLEKLEGKKLRIEITDVAFRLDIHIQENQLQFLPIQYGFKSSASTADSIVDTIIRGPLSAFSSLVLNKDVQLASRQGLVVEGDLDTGQEFRDLMLCLELDWEEWLSRYTGDIVANSVGQFVRNVREKRRKFADSLSQNISEYLQEEVELLPRKEEVEDFIQAVDKLKHDVDRLEARIRHLS